MKQPADHPCELAGLARKPSEPAGSALRWRLPGRELRGSASLARPFRTQQSHRQDWLSALLRAGWRRSQEELREVLINEERFPGRWNVSFRGRVRLGE